MSIARLIKSGVVQAGLVSVALLSGSAMAGTSATSMMQLAAVSDGFDAEATYMKTCFACHNSGAAGAPKVGVASDWAPRLEKGFEEVYLNALNGFNAMPAKGICFTCTDDDLRAVVQYMVDNSK